jgi:1-acyl-sn-glycerol-3-phosphate acyltransferase
VPAEASPVVLRSPVLHRFFHAAFRRRARAGLRAIRLASWGRPEAVEVPMVVFANHPSWWDGVAFMLLAESVFPGRQMYAPMADEALARYRFMRRIGVFGVEAGTPRGALAFLRGAEQVLASPGGMLWVNAPGRFMDARERPVPIMRGLTRLAELAPTTVFLPLAVEYPFWGEPQPEMLCGFGSPLTAAALRQQDRPGRTAMLAATLEATMDRLASDAISRDPTRFETLLHGREGMGGAWQLWRRVGATLRGQRFDPRHEQGRLTSGGDRQTSRTEERP